jgi:hypothetical protein
MTSRSVELNWIDHCLNGHLSVTLQPFSLPRIIFLRFYALAIPEFFFECQRRLSTAAAEALRT